MTSQDPKMIEAIFAGNDYKVEFGAYDTSHRTTVRDTMGDYAEEWCTEWQGWVTVHSKITGERLAACKLGIHHGYGYEAVRSRIYLDDLIPGMEKSYADFIAKKVLETFKKGEAKGIPIFTLIYRFDDWKMEQEYYRARRQELLEAGLVLDENGQRMLALKE